MQRLCEKAKGDPWKTNSEDLEEHEEIPMPEDAGIFLLEIIKTGTRYELCIGIKTGQTGTSYVSHAKSIFSGICEQKLSDCQVEYENSNEASTIYDEMYKISKDCYKPKLVTTRGGHVLNKRCIPCTQELPGSLGPKTFKV